MPGSSFSSVKAGKRRPPASLSQQFASASWLADLIAQCGANLKDIGDP